jgi:hypothetical protein
LVDILAVLKKITYSGFQLELVRIVVLDQWNTSREVTVLHDKFLPIRKSKGKKSDLHGKRQRDPNGIRTRVTAVKGRCPRPLDDRVTRARAISELLLFDAR